MRHIMLLCINEQSQPKHVAKLYKKVEAAKNASCERYVLMSVFVGFRIVGCGQVGNQIRPLSSLS